MAGNPLDPPRDVAWQLVCAAAACGFSSGGASTGDLEQVAALCERKPSWNAVVALSQWHRVSPLLHATLRHVPRSLVPADVAMTLAREHARTAARNLRATTGCQMILRRLENAGLHPLTYKGPTLALAAYGGLGLRVFEDVDIIVSRDEIARALEVFEAAGYRLGTGISPAQAAASFDAGRGLPFVDPRGWLSIDLHAALAPRYLPLALDHAQLAPHTRRVDVIGEMVTTLDPEMLLLALSVHGVKHSWERLYWLCDVAALTADRGGIDWPRLWSLARRWRVERMVRLGLLLAERVLGVSAPAGVSEWMRADRVATGLSTRVAARLERPVAARWSGLDAARLHFDALQGVTARARFCRHVVEPNAGDWEAQRLPASLALLHYPMRVWRLFTRGLSAERPPATGRP